MQDLLEGPRAGLAEAAVIGLLQTSSTVNIDYGCEWIDTAFNVVQDISEYLQAGGTVSSDITATIHRSCNLTFDAANADGVAFPVPYLSDFVRPYMLLSDPTTGIEAQFYLGVYTLQSPAFDYSSAVATLAFAGLDLLALLNSSVGDSFTAPAGTDPIASALTLLGTVVPNATVVGAGSGEVLTADAVWPYSATSPTTYLTIINALLASVGYLPLWVDWTGAFQMQAYSDPEAQDFDWTFDLSTADNVVAEARTSDQDLYDVPNWWRFVMNNLSVAPVEGTTQFTFQDLDSASPTSQISRGRVVRATYGVDATSYATLQQAAAQQIALDQTPAETFAVSSSPFPLVWHRDVILYLDEALLGTPPMFADRRRVLATNWEITLDGTADMTWRWQTVSTV